MNNLYADIDTLQKRIKELEAENERLKRDNNVCASLNDTFPQEITRLEDQLHVIREVYFRYGHLDDLLSDKQWLYGSSPKRTCLNDLWQAVKQAASKMEKK